MAGVSGGRAADGTGWVEGRRGLTEGDRGSAELTRLGGKWRHWQESQVLPQTPVMVWASVRHPTEYKPHPHARTQQLQPVHSDKSVSLPYTHCCSSTVVNLNNESKKKVGHADGGVRRGSKYPSCPARRPFTDGLQHLLTRLNIFIHISVGVDSAKS